MKSQQSQKGFGAVEIILLIVAIAALMVGGWYVWQAQQNTNKQQSANTSQQTAVDPYAGWKTYCDDTYKTCFKYPSDWVVSGEGAANTSTSIQNPLGTLAVSYMGEDTRDGREMSIYAAHVGDLATANSKYKSLGYFVSSTTNSLPSYNVVDSALLTAFPLTAGTQGTFPVNPRFTNSNGQHGSLSAKPIGQVFNDDQAKAWFGSDEAKLGLAIINSFYSQ